MLKQKNILYLQSKLKNNYNFEFINVSKNYKKCYFYDFLQLFTYFLKYFYEKFVYLENLSKKIVVFLRKFNNLIIMNI